MKIPSAFAATMTAVLLAASAGSPAWAQGDIYSRLMDMRAMDQDRDGMISKEEFMAAMARVWDNYVTEKKIAGGRMPHTDLQELQKILGRSIGAGG